MTPPGADRPTEVSLICSKSHYQERALTVRGSGSGCSSEFEAGDTWTLCTCVELVSSMSS